MKRRTILLLSVAFSLAIYTLSYQQKPRLRAYDLSIWGEEQPAIDLHVPDAVTTYPSALHLKIPATGLSMIVPDGYEQTVDFKGYSRGTDTCIDVIEQHNVGLGAKRKEVDQYVAYAKKDHWRDQSIQYRKDFKFNGYDAFIVCVSDTTSNKTAIFMAFGDDHFNVAMTGTMAQNTEENRAEILNTMLTACYQKA